MDVDAGEDVQIHIHVHVGGAADATKIDQVLEGLQGLSLKGDEMAADLTAITNEVAEAKTVAESAVALINGFGAQLDALVAEAQDNKVDVAKVEELRASLDSSNQELTDAITANTPESPTP
jgi:hypothetical protein